MASIGRRGWRRAKTSLTTKFDKRVTLPLADVLERVTRLQDQVAELTDIVRTQVRMANETTELLGRLLATASSRLDAVEDSLARIRAAPAPGPGAIPLRPGGPTASRPREEQRAFLGFEEKTASPGSESETASPGSEEKTASYGSE